MSAEPEDPGHFTQFGPYQVLREIGVGGSGRVFLCRHRKLSRLAAVKVIALSADIWARRQFENEIKVVQTFDHDGIATIYDSDVLSTDEGEFGWLAMEYFPMGRLDDYAREQQKDVRWILQCITDICSTLFAAEHQEILHRDIKPGNILVDDAGRPHLSDFGLAETETLPLQTAEPPFRIVRGTPSFMAPELESGRSPANVQSEIYSLGVVLFLLLAGRHPFRTGDPEAPLADVERAKQSPPRLRDARPDCSIDLEYVVARMLAPEPSRRYQTYGDVLSDLYCLQEGRPVSARPLPLPQRMMRWAIRNPLPAGLAAVFSLLVAVLTVQLTFSVAELRHYVGEVDTRNRQLIAQKDALQQSTVSSRLRTIQNLVESHRTLARRKLNDEGLFPTHMRGFAWQYLNRRAQDNEIDLTDVGGGFNPIHRVHFTPDDRKLLVRFKPGALAFVDLESRTRRDLDQSVCVASTPLFRPDRPTFYLHLDPRTLVEIDWQEARIVADHRLPVPVRLRQTIAADGSAVLGVTADGFPYRYLPATGEFLRGDDATQSRPAGLWLTPDGSELHCVTAHGRWVRWGTARLDLLDECGLHETVLAGTPIDPNSRITAACAYYEANFQMCLAVAFECGVCSVLWPESERPATVFARSSPLTTHIRFRRGSQCLIPDGRSGRMFSVFDQETQSHLSGQQDTVLSLALSPSESRIATGGSHGQLLIRDLPDSSTGRRTIAPFHGLRDEGFGPAVQLLPFHEGRQLLLFHRQNWIALTNQSGRSLQQAFRLAEGQFKAAAYHPKTNLLAVGTLRPNPGIILLDGPTEGGWPAPATDSAESPRPINDEQVADEDFKTSQAEPDSSSVSASSVSALDQRLTRFTNRPTVRKQLRTERGVTAVAFSPEGTRLIAGLRDGTLISVGAQTGEVFLQVNDLDSERYVRQIVCSGDVIFCGCRRGEIRVYDQSLQLQRNWQANRSRITALLFDRERRRLIAGAEDGSITAFSESGERLLRLLGHDQAVRALAITADGQVLASCGADHQIGIWDAATGEQQLSLQGHQGPVTDVRFSSDGLTLWSAGGDSACFAWSGIADKTPR